MLREAPERQTEGESDTVPEEEDELLFCAACGALVTRGAWSIAVDGGHAHSRFNPMGLRFHIRLFKEAPGAAAAGPAHASFTWFPGYRWRMAGCRKCATHLGWRYEGARGPRVFFGLIDERLRANACNFGD